MSSRLIYSNLYICVCERESFADGASEAFIQSNNVILIMSISNEQVTITMF